MFDDLIKNMDASLLHVFGSDTTWTRDSSMNSRAIMDKDVVRANEYGEVIRNSYEIYMPRPVGTQPRLGDTFTFSNVAYKVDNIITDDGFIIRLAASKI